MIYIDNNATTPLDAEVSRSITESLVKYGNPSSSHDIGREAKALLEASRSSVSSLLNCTPGEIFFTSGGTESNNLAIMGVARLRGKGHIITSLIEHPSVMNPVKQLQSNGFTVTYVGVDGQCRVRTEDIEKAVRQDTVLITIMHSNNETGAIQPVEEIYGIAKRNGITFHTDAAQSIGKIPFLAGADMITVVPHKFYGPKGTGALYIRKGIIISPVLFGAGHERGLRPGTENMPGIAGFGKACEIAVRDVDARVGHSSKLKEMLLDGLSDNIGKLRVNGQGAHCLPNTLNVCVPGVDAIGIVASLHGRLALSTGSACHTGVKKPSAVLKAMGISDEDALSSFRFSLGKDNTEEDVKAAVRIFSDALRLRVRAL